MSDFQTAYAEPLVLDPYWRVHYATGLVLGAEEFVQEELYFLEKNRLHNRALHGYGTICGLRVRQDGPESDPEIVVEPGVAVDPQGREIRVPVAQCARLNQWLADHGADLRPGLGSPPLGQTLYVVLCYRECKTRTVPIPSGPCRSIEDSAVPSRVADDFELKIQDRPPEQVEEACILELGTLLRRIEITDTPGPFESALTMAERVRALCRPQSPPLASPPDGSPPATLRVHPADVDQVFRTAFRVWVTEVRPRLLPDGRNCASGPPREGCVLLAELTLDLDASGSQLRVGGPITIDDRDRPYLLQTRLLQEWLMGTATALSVGGVTVHADLQGLLADDHPHYLLADGTRPLDGDWDVGGVHRVRNLPAGLAAGDAVPFEQAIKDGDPAGGAGTNSDLDSTYPFPSVVRLQGRPVAANQPQLNQVLTWVAAGGGQPARWAPRPLPPAPPPVNFERLVRIVALSWEHDDQTDFQLSVDGQPRSGVAVGFGVEDLGDAAILVERGSLDENTFQLYLELEHGQTPVLMETVRVTRTMIVPVEPRNPPDLLDLRSLPGPDAPAAALLFEPGPLDPVLGRIRRAIIVVRGDFVLDTERRAIDAEHLRSQLPTGDRPAGAELGLTGGTFWSWVTPAIG